MTALAAASSALFAYLLVGVLTGRAPSVAGWRRRRSQVGRQQLWLVQAGTDLTPRQFWLGSVGAGVATFLLVTLLTATPAVAIVPAVAVGALPRAGFARRRARRMRELSEAWPDGVRDLLAAISAGMSLNQAVVSLSQTGPAALREAFGRYPSLARMVGVVPALEVVKEELADPTSDRIIEVLILAHEKGGHLLSEILRDLAEATTKDVRALEAIQTESLEQRINARAVFVLPWAVLLVLTLRPGYFRDFYRSGGGVLVVVVGALLSLLGLWLVTRLAREPVERRVLGAAATVTAEEARG
ncbi:MAG: type II secretion system F family protein [Actinobacteria bacterium]|nr:type II secretion system F family protein [Actinomycetota bacterium]